MSEEPHRMGPESRARAPLKVGVLLLNWNGFEDTARCLRSLRASTVKPDRILVWDNASSGGDAERIGREFPEVQVHRSEENLGFTGGNNAGAEILLAAGMEAIWILNNDTRVEPDCLEELVAALEGDPGVGIATGKIRFMEDPEKIACAGGEISPNWMRVTWRGTQETDRGQWEEACDVGLTTGCCALVRAAVLREAGLFHPGFFCYWEDVEWSLRVRKAGWRIRYCPKASLQHRMYGSSQSDRKKAGRAKSTPFTAHLLCRNRIYLIRLHSRGFRRIAAVIWFLLSQGLLRGFGLLLVGDFRRAGAIWRGMGDGFFRRLSPVEAGGRSGGGD